MNLEDRRIAIGKRDNGLYIFRNGVYGSWLNGNVFNAVTAGTHGSPSYNIAIVDGRLNLTVNQGTYNRTSNYAFGIQMPTGIDVKKVGIFCTIDNGAQGSSLFRFGVSETLNPATGGVAGATVYTGLGICSLSDSDTSNNTVYAEFLPSAESEGYRNYVTILRSAFSRISGQPLAVTVSIKKLWIEV